MSESDWDKTGKTPADSVGEIARNLLLLFGCMFALSCAAQVDPAGIAAQIIGDEAPVLVKLCGTMMAICLGIIYWQQRELSALSKQSRADFRDMIRTTNRFMDYLDDKIKGHSTTTYVDEDVAGIIKRRTQHGQRDEQRG